MIITLQTLIFFRESLISVIDKLLRPYYKKLSFQFKVNDNSDDDDDSGEHVFAEYDDEKGVVFFPPVYAQRYAAVVDCLMDERWCGELEKVIDFGYHDMSFIKYLKDVPGIKHILGVDIETIPVQCSSDLLRCENYVPKRECPLQVTLFQGNAADPDYRLIGSDAVIAIEMIEHMLPHDLERFVHTVFGFIKPRIAIFTTPNGDFNVLFKALEKNGLRRLDHFFEWSREQFHDWCSNIVARYPQYTVMSKGIGPGPPDTSHLGCCSQLALFIAKDYQKQPDLNLNSLALVAKAPSPNNLTDMTDSWESPDSISDTMLCLENNEVNDESYTQFLINQQSYMTIVITSPSFSLENLSYQDKILQCNLESELGKNFLMFDDEVYFNVLVPRRKKLNRVYEIEDVASRLNCSMIQVTKFSKVTQGLMAKNKTDNIGHTREVVDEIRHLTKMLNFNKNKSSERFHGNHIWYNINWGENAPYWNQYYKIVREYNYPFEVKSNDCRILDAISEEINALIDTEQPGDLSVDSHKFEIPIDRLMKSVEHITTDVDKVKELLEWNGYDVVDDVVIYTRLVVDNISLDTREEDWQEDTLSDWDTSDLRSNSISDGSTTVPDCYGRYLRRALDQKVRKLRALFTVDEDITTELDRIVCRLMKLALYTSKERRDPPPASWMQWKLFDLLTLTERAIERRRRHELENYTIKAIEYYNENKNDKNMIYNDHDDTVEKIVSKYYDVVTESDVKLDGIKQTTDFEIDKTSKVTNNVEEFDNNNIDFIHNIKEGTLQNGAKSPLEKVIDETVINVANEDSDQNVYELMACPSCENENDFNEYNVTNANLLNQCTFVFDPYAKISDLSDAKDDNKYSKLNLYELNETIVEPFCEKLTKNGKKSKSKTKFVRKISSKIVNSQHKIKRKKVKEHQKLQSTLSKPIPDSLIKLCDPGQQENEKDVNESYKKSFLDGDDNNANTNHLIKVQPDIAATENSIVLGIVTEYGEESIALRRNIGIDPAFAILDNELSETVVNVTKGDDFLCRTNNADSESATSQTIFLYDINEPSTSKGVRNLNTDAQCGPDVSLTCAAISATTSLTEMSNMFYNGIKINDSCTKVQVNRKTSDFGTCTDLRNDATGCYPVSMGIKIKDSDIDIHVKNKCSTMTETTPNLTFNSNCVNESMKSNKFLEPEVSILKTEDSCSEPCSSVFSLPKRTSRHSGLPNNKSDIQIQSISTENIAAKGPQISYGKRSLIYGGIHMHSFTERVNSEDVVYQGEWQRMRPAHRKKNQDVIVIRSNSLQRSKKLNKTEHSNNIDVLKKLGVNQPNKISIKSTLRKIKSSDTNKKNVNRPINQSNINIKNYININKTVVKTSSKVVMSSPKPRNKKTFYQNTLTIDLNPLSQNKYENVKICKKKNYIPMYLKRKKGYSNNDINSKIKFEPKIAALQNDKEIFFSSMKEEITKELLKFTENINIKNYYMICRNENEIQSSAGKKLSTSTPERVNSSINSRSHSPPSQNSSTCSSPNSVATVRAVYARNKTMLRNRNNSNSSENNVSDLFVEDKSLKSKNCSKRYKNIKKSPNKLRVICNNKENIPESSKNISSSKSERQKPSAFVGKTKSVFMAKATAANSTLLLTSGTIKKNEFKKISAKHYNPMDKQTFCLPDAIMKQNDNIFNNNIECNNEESCSSLSNSNISDLQPIKDDQIYSNSTIEHDSDELNSPNSVHSTESSIMFAIRQLIEQKIHVTETYSHDSIDSGSETIILNREDINDSSFNNSSSPLSISTVIANEDNILQSDVENELVDLTMTDQNYSLLSCVDVKQLTKETDSISIKSSDLSSVSTSKFSEYYLADNELDNTMNISSIQDIFERNDHNIANIDGILAAQAFSGFSINTGSFPGDRLDMVNLVDSETGSVTLSSARQAVSEELFVSGRSSDTYESCLVEDDAYVPNWLFNAISQQPSIAESEVEDDFLPIPLGEPEFDINGNALEPGVGVGAGAGDGRGMHSDQSQDSSGRGTSLSSSATSSGQSEAILIDLSAIAANQPHFVQVPMNIPEVDDEIAETNRSVEGDTVNNRDRPRNTNNAQITSDVDADVSSLDTDDVDSDD